MHVPNTLICLIELFTHSSPANFNRYETLSVSHNKVHTYELKSFQKCMHTITGVYL